MGLISIFVGTSLSPPPNPFFHMGVPNHVPRTHKRRLSIGLGDMDTKLGRYTTRVRGKKTD